MSNSGCLGTSCHILMVIILCTEFQALDNNFTDENRQRCAEAAKPLTDAVEELTTFASSPEFASKPAKISEKVHKTWLGILRDFFMRKICWVLRKLIGGLS